MNRLMITKPKVAILTDQKLMPLAKSKIRVAVKRVGICGSDLHYYFEGRCGNFIIQEPLTPGHEFSGVVSEINDNTSKLKIGSRVAINPSYICRECEPCRDSKNNLCENNVFFGTASTTPHTQGACSSYIDLYPEQCFPLSDHVSFEEGASAEPLAVSIHALTHAPKLSGKRVLILGAGTIGSIIAQLVKLEEASKIIVTDIEDYPLEIASKMGATEVINTLKNKDGLSSFLESNGKFDIIFEATGNVFALNSAFTSIKRGGTIIQIGVMNDYSKATHLSYIMSNEICYTGTMRFTENDYIKAIDLINNQTVNLEPILSSTVPITDFEEAFNLASDKTKAIKVHLNMTP